MESKNIKYLPQIDHLRAFVALLIVFYHGNLFISYWLIHNTKFTFNHWLKAGNPFSALLIEGHSAVALFMVLSGFIFTIGTYGKEIHYTKFIKNRLLRTYPLFILLLFVGMASFPDKFNFLSFIELVIPVKADFLNNKFSSFSAMFWTIIIEWQFYLIFPFLLTFLNQKGVKFLAGFILVFFLMRFLSLCQGGYVLGLSYFSIIGRMDQFIIGMACGVYYKKHFRPRLKLDLLFILSIIFVLSLLYTYNLQGGWPKLRASLRIIWPVLEGAGWGLFLITYLSASRYLPKFLSKIFAKIGTISYSIYLIHYVIVNSMVKRQWLIIVPDMNPVGIALLNTIIIVIPVVLLISTITYQYIEKPFLNLRVIYKKE